MLHFYYMKNYFLYKYNFCDLLIAEDDKAICNVLFKIDERLNGFEKKETPLIKSAAKQLDEYFRGKLKDFDLPLVLYGTDFQKKVWKALQTIPYGETRSYGQIAGKIGNTKASRAVGMANNRNPISIIVPCHRVVGSSGSLTGYAGGLELKEKLILLEEASR